MMKRYVFVNTHDGGEMIELPVGEIVRCDCDGNRKPDGIYATMEELTDEQFGRGRMFLAHDVFVRYSEISCEFGPTKDL